jgi:general stress protein YciG
MASKKTKKNPAAVALGRLGGLKGGKARAKKLTPEQRSEIARQGGLKRWPAKKA